MGCLFIILILKIVSGMLKKYRNILQEDCFINFTQKYCAQTIQQTETVSNAFFRIRCDENRLMTLYKLTHNLIDSPLKRVSSSHRPTRFVFRSAVTRKCRISFFHSSIVLWNKYEYITSNFQSFLINIDSFSDYISTNQSNFTFGSA